MKADSLSRRLAALEDDPEQDTVLVAHRWVNEDNTPASDWIERRVPRSRIQTLENLFEMSEERDRHEEQCHEKT